MIPSPKSHLDALSSTPLIPLRNLITTLPQDYNMP